MVFFSWDSMLINHGSRSSSLGLDAAIIDQPWVGKRRGAKKRKGRGKEEEEEEEEEATKRKDEKRQEWKERWRRKEKRGRPITKLRSQDGRNNLCLGCSSVLFSHLLFRYSLFFLTPTFLPPPCQPFCFMKELPMTFGCRKRRIEKNRDKKKKTRHINEEIEIRSRSFLFRQNDTRQRVFGSECNPISTLAEQGLWNANERKTNRTREWRRRDDDEDGEEEDGEEEEERRKSATTFLFGAPCVRYKSLLRLSLWALNRVQGLRQQ